MKLLETGADPENGRAWMAWEDQGFMFRANVMLYPGAQIPMHAHTFDHHYRLGRGVYGLIVESPEGVRAPEVELPAFSRGFVPKFWKHHFRLIQMDKEPGRIECYWPVGTPDG